MNIFYLDDNPEICAQYHCDKHVIKMILEYTQLLSNISCLQGNKVIYKPTHLNHPCCKWLQTSYSNVRWLFLLLNALHKEWQYRYNHSYNHKCYNIYNNLIINPFNDIGFIEPYKATNNQYLEYDSLTAYRLYYNNDKKHLHKWTKRNIPFFIQ